MVYIHGLWSILTAIKYLWFRKKSMVGKNPCYITLSDFHWWVARWYSGWQGCPTASLGGVFTFFSHSVIWFLPKSKQRRLDWTHTALFICVWIRYKTEAWKKYCVYLDINSIIIIYLATKCFSFNQKCFFNHLWLYSQFLKRKLRNVFG